MSQHIVMEDEKKYVFGWDPPLMSFFLQVHDLTLPEDQQIILWRGATVETLIYEIEDLVSLANKHGLQISPTLQVTLYRERDDGI